MKESKFKYRCDNCGEEFFVPVKPELCPTCGSCNINKGTKKSLNTAKEYIDELNIIIPQMEELSASFSNLYVRYMTLHETLKSYASRGIIDKQMIPNFTIPKFTEAFYASRKSKKSNNRR